MPFLSHSSRRAGASNISPPGIPPTGWGLEAEAALHKGKFASALGGLPALGCLGSCSAAVVRSAVGQGAPGRSTHEIALRLLNLFLVVPEV